MFENCNIKATRGPTRWFSQTRCLLLSVSSVPGIYVAEEENTEKLFCHLDTRMIF